MVAAFRSWLKVSVSNGLRFVLTSPTLEEKNPCRKSFRTNITFIKQTVQSFHENEVAIKTKYSPTPTTWLLIFVIFQHLIRQILGEWGGFLLKGIELGVSIMPRVSFAQLLQVDVDVMAVRDGEGMMHPGVHSVPRHLEHGLNLLMSGLGLLLHPIHALDELANELTRCSVVDGA